MQTLFIADLHLSDNTPDLNALFAQFLRDHAGKATALYILGDLFEAWTGDDDDSATAAQVATEIRAFSQTAPVYFIAGNRDFLLGKHYAAQANMTLLPENHLIELFGQKILLTHGDEMCTDDVAYLRYRRVMRCAIVQKILLALPFRKRKQIAENLRAKSRARKQYTNVYAISDVTEAGVQAALRQFSDISLIIHGHTHRPNTHHHYFAEREITRYVLPDWYDGAGGYLAVDETGIAFFRLPEKI
ncbi:UDP-2,3-diacylglucosamine diphosphatase [Wielerella bovis]|uniref:UDP-2,3-diacylglucosamine diphosphatase n=1 Tax=Wielerella bovis TaxID=2917790 RepID=UPI002019B67C|nr:UDP-2,3-diacylglucosamine diphosphatase [Wielerella bovis]MCG7656821.1 UDP-2,3-diacylglucosamine diphosphatase [Wielerella bovis]MCG7659044.1 UDP-2,3-diacylglucosamine diphosphatase [Wielerella bovis]